MLTKKQFDVLTYIERNAEQISEKNIADKTKLSLEEVKSTIKELTEQNFIANNTITANGLEALEPYRVKRAIFLAAGFGSRLVPITINTPKPLIKVNGVKMIENSIEALLKAGIEEIYIVRGYLKECFDILLYKYPMIKFIDNDIYSESNLIYSAHLAGDLICNAYVLEADLVISNPEIITKYQYSSNFLGVPVEHTEDWVFYTENGYIQGVGMVGDNCHQVIGISYWNNEDGERLAGHFSEVCSTAEGRKQYFSYAPFNAYKNEYNIAIRECAFEDVIEIDSFKELMAIDPLYKV